MALNPDVTSAKLLVTLAATGVIPIRRSAGYETSEANPAAELMVPAAIPATTNQQSVTIQCIMVKVHLFFIIGLSVFIVPRDGDCFFTVKGR